MIFCTRCIFLCPFRDPRPGGAFFCLPRGIFQASQPCAALVRLFVQPVRARADPVLDGSVAAEFHIALNARGLLLRHARRDASLVPVAVFGARGAVCLGVAFRAVPGGCNRLYRCPCVLRPCNSILVWVRRLTVQRFVVALTSRRAHDLYALLLCQPHSVFPLSFVFCADAARPRSAVMPTAVTKAPKTTPNKSAERMMFTCLPPFYA